MGQILFLLKVYKQIDLENINNIWKENSEQVKEKKIVN